MIEDFSNKSSVEDIRRRFDADVERFSRLETGQTATIDARLTMDLVISAAAGLCPGAKSVLDIGCGAGNYTLRLLQDIPGLEVTLIDLSSNMLERAVERIRPHTSGHIEPLEGDIREMELGEERFDLILASQVFHHLRGEGEWRTVFTKCYCALRSGGALMINDLVAHSGQAVEDMMRRRWGQYLAELKDEAYRDHVLAYVDIEDSPRPLYAQLALLDQAGFQQIDVLHKNLCFAAFYAVK